MPVLVSTYRFHFLQNGLRIAEDAHGHLLELWHLGGVQNEMCDQVGILAPEAPSLGQSIGYGNLSVHLRVAAGMPAPCHPDLHIINKLPMQQQLFMRDGWQPLDRPYLFAPRYWRQRPE